MEAPRQQRLLHGRCKHTRLPGDDWRTIHTLTASQQKRAVALPAGVIAAAAADGAERPPCHRVRGAVVCAAPLRGEERRPYARGHASRATARSERAPRGTAAGTRERRTRVGGARGDHRQLDRVTRHCKRHVTGAFAESIFA